LVAQNRARDGDAVVERRLERVERPGTQNGPGLDECEVRQFRRTCRSVIAAISRLLRDDDVGAGEGQGADSALELALSARRDDHRIWHGTLYAVASPSSAAAVAFLNSPIRM